ncbi:hypothetical protein DL98DRAFT_592787 [Cadophora sp. DSE1049]|nr:hypothetical protein DL98DRAFT_592787 [Cadophora sp. DSE1049]
MTRYSVRRLALGSLITFGFATANIVDQNPNQIAYPSSCAADLPLITPTPVYLDFMDEQTYEIYHVCTTVGTYCTETSDCVQAALFYARCPEDSEWDLDARNVFCDGDGVCKAKPQIFPESTCGCLIGCEKRTQWSNGWEMGCVKGNCTVLKDREGSGFEEW